MSDLSVSPLAFTRGNPHGTILFVGEAWGADEDRAKQPFVGASGKELSRMLFEAGILETSILFTNVVDARPPGNDFSHFLHKTKDAKGKLDFRGLYPHTKLIDGVAKLHNLIAQVQPQLIIGAGNVPLWALTKQAKIANTAGYRTPGGVMKYRGSQLYTYEIEGQAYPYLPIVHPAAILRSWDLRAVTIHDLKRGARGVKDISSWGEPPNTFIHRPSPGEAKAHLRDWLKLAVTTKLKLSIDIETYAHNTITCIGIADHRLALCLPLFYYKAGTELTHYFNPSDEVDILLLFRDLCNHPNVRIIGQNYNYDYQYLWRFYNITKPIWWDTMVAQNLLFPGTPKDLSYLSSLYCQHHVYWKDESQDWAGTGEPETLWLYNCKDVRATYDIAEAQQKLVEKIGYADLYNDQREQWQLAAAMAIRGTKVDKVAMGKIRSELYVAGQTLETELTNCMPDDLTTAPSGKPWYKSPIFQREIFYDYIGLKPILHKKTKKPTLDAQALASLREKTPWLKSLFDRLELLRSIHVFSSNFLDVRLSPGDRISCSFNIGGTETFRWSSNTNSFGEGTNLQNIPSGDPE